MPFLLIAGLAVEAGHVRMAFDLILSLLGFPLLLAAMVETPIRRDGTAMLGFLGDISYPLYATHYPLIIPLGMIAKQLEMGSYHEIAFVTLCSMFAAVMASRADRLVRGRLSNLLHIQFSAQSREI